MKNDNNTSRSFLFYPLLLAAFVAALYVLKPVLMPFAAGILVGYLFDPLAGKLAKLGLPRGIAAALIIALAIMLAVPLIAWLASAMVAQLAKLAAMAPAYAAVLMEKIPDIGIENIQIKQYLADNAASAAKLIAALAAKIVGGSMAFVNIISLLLITPVVAFYMLKDWPRFVAKIDSLLPKSDRNSIRRLARDIDRAIAGFLRGQLSVCLVLGAFYAAGLYFVGLNYGVAVGLAAGLVSFVPYIGAASGFGVAAAVAAIQFDGWSGVAQTAAVFAAGQVLEGAFLTPKLVGESVGLHPVWIMFALLAGGALLGFFGMLIAVPAAAVIGVVIRHRLEAYKKSPLYLEK